MNAVSKAMKIVFCVVSQILEKKSIKNRYSAVMGESEDNSTSNSCWWFEQMSPDGCTEV